MLRSARLRGKLRDAGSAAAAPLRSPADAGSAGPLPPGRELRPGARYRRRVSREGRRLPGRVATGFLSPPASALPVSAAAQHPTRPYAASPDALPGASAAAGRSHWCPGGGAHRLPPLRPSPPGGCCRSAPLRPRSSPAAAPADSGEAPPPGWALPLRCTAAPSPACSSSTPGGGQRARLCSRHRGNPSFGRAQPKTRSPLKMHQNSP